VVRPRIMRPTHANFPRYSGKFIEQPEKNKFIITAYVNTLDEENAVVSYDFVVQAKYLGNDIFEEISTEVIKRE